MRSGDASRSPAPLSHAEREAARAADRPVPRLRRGRGAYILRCTLPPAAHTAVHALLPATPGGHMPEPAPPGFPSARTDGLLPVRQRLSLLTFLSRRRFLPEKVSSARAADARADAEARVSSLRAAR